MSSSKILTTILQPNVYISSASKLLSIGPKLSYIGHKSAGHGLTLTAKSYLVTATSQKQQQNNWSTLPLALTLPYSFHKRRHMEVMKTNVTDETKGGPIHVQLCVAPRQVLQQTHSLRNEKFRNEKNKSFCRNSTTCFDWMIRAVKASEVWGKHCYYGCYYATVDHNSAPCNNEGVSTSNLFIAVYLCMNMHCNTTSASDTLLPENENAWHSKPSHRHRGTLCWSSWWNNTAFYKHLCIRRAV